MCTFWLKYRFRSPRHPLLSGRGGESKFERTDPGARWRHNSMTTQTRATPVGSFHMLASTGRESDSAGSSRRSNARAAERMAGLPDDASRKPPSTAGSRSDASCVRHFADRRDVGYLPWTHLRRVRRERYVAAGWRAAIRPLRRRLPRRLRPRPQHLRKQPRAVRYRGRVRRRCTRHPPISRSRPSVLPRPRRPLLRHQHRRCSIPLRRTQPPPRRPLGPLLRLSRPLPRLSRSRRRPPPPRRPPGTRRRPRPRPRARPRSRPPTGPPPTTTTTTAPTTVLPIPLPLPLPIPLPRPL